MSIHELIEDLTLAQATLDQVPQLSAALVSANQRIETLEATNSAQAAEVAWLKALLAQYAPLVSTAHVPADNADLVALHATMMPPTATATTAGYASAFGWTIKSWYVAVLLGYLASGDTFIIDKLEVAMDAYESKIREPAITFYTINESHFCSFLLLHALVMKQHGRAWQKWFDIWKARYPGGVSWDDVTHCYFASIESYAYLFLLTGDKSARAERDARIKIAVPYFIPLANGLFDVNQRMPIAADGSDRIAQAPELNYMRYTAASVILLHQMGIETISPQWFADTIYGRTFLPDGAVAFYLNGTLKGMRTFDAAKWRSSNLGFLGKWHPAIAAHTISVSAGGDSAHLAAARLYTKRQGSDE